MYLPDHFKELDRNKAFELVRNNPLATLLLSSTHELNANHIPFYLDPASGAHGMLLGHIPRANPLSKTTGTCETLAIFHGPNSYITPNWYPTKRETGKVVPTWNYQVAHIHGTLRIVDDSNWVMDQLEALTNHNESKFPEPWRVTDAPQEFTTKMIKMLVGIKILITKVIAKSKISQNQPEDNRIGVAEGLSTSSSTADKEMAKAVRATTPNTPIDKV